MELNAHELRIGNYVRRKNGRIAKIEREDFAYHVGLANLEDNEPIPLTEEWLLKFGFKEGEWKDKTSSQYLYHTNGTLHISDSRDVNYSFESPCKHVHQLQNLFFALTGEELELK